jgi:hypothetical protein
MRRRLLLLAVVLLAAPVAFAGSYSLNDWCFYVNTLDINHSCNNGSGVDNFLPPISAGSFDYLHLTDNNLGTTTVNLGSGTYNVFAIFNYDIAPGGGLNEYATAVGSLAIGQVYSVDTEGASNSTPGELYTQFANGTLDDTNHLPSCAASPCGDVAVAIGFTNLVIPTGNTGTVTFTVSDTAPASGFYIQQTNSSTGGSLGGSSAPPGSSLFFSATFVDPPGAPEPGTIGLMAGGLGLMLWAIRRRRTA